MKVKQVRKYVKKANRVAIVVSNPNTNKTEKKNNKQKKEDMTLEQIEKAEVLAQNLDAPQKVKVVKKDRGLIERTESSKIVLTEDNRQVLTD